MRETCKDTVPFVQGVSPALSLELCSLAGIAPQDPADTPSADWEALRSQWQAWLTRLSQGKAWQFCLCDAQISHKQSHVYSHK